MDMRAFQRLVASVEGILDLFYDKARHLAVDVASQFDETGFNTSLSCFPRQIERVYRNAMPAQPGSWIEGHKAERLAGSGLDDFPDIDAHAIAHHGHFIHQPDVN